MILAFLAFTMNRSRHFCNLECCNDIILCAFLVLVHIMFVLWKVRERGMGGNRGMWGGTSISWSRHQEGKGRSELYGKKDYKKIRKTSKAKTFRIGTTYTLALHIYIYFHSLCHLLLFSVECVVFEVVLYQTRP